MDASDKLSNKIPLNRIWGYDMLTMSLESAVIKVPAWFTVQTRDAARWVPAIALFSFVWDILTSIIAYSKQMCNRFLTQYLAFCCRKSLVRTTICCVLRSGHYYTRILEFVNPLSVQIIGYESWLNISDFFVSFFRSSRGLWRGRWCPVRHRRHGEGWIFSVVQSFPERPLTTYDAGRISIDKYPNKWYSIDK